ncbi:MAG: ASKHA domain-containing protein [Oscillospiraceae bacterium]
MFHVKISIGDSTSQFIKNEPTLISKILSECNVSFSMPCGGNHSCGKCKVRVFGEISEISQSERALLSDEEIADGIRLACFATVSGDCSIQTNYQKALVETGFISPVSVDSNEIGHAFVVDIGTTTIASYLFEAGALQPLDVIGELNNQRNFGSDVISRIEYTNHNPHELHKVIISQLKTIFNRMLENRKLSKDDITKIIVTGNTTMLHILMDYDPKSLALFPFDTVSLFNESFCAADIFDDFKNAVLYIPGCVSAYVGADLVCSVVASGMCAKDETALLVDIGTNGEMALTSNQKLYTCSTAAGPAFEGAGIKMGMFAGDGAVDNVFYENGIITYHTINDCSPVGICGSGIINAIALFIKLGLIDETGSISDENKDLTQYIGFDDDCDYIKIGNSGIVITGKDIRQIQLAKSAICAGMLTLIHECKLDIENIEKLYICGGFGNSINIQSACAIGLIPPQFADKTALLGNGAANGAAMILCSAKSAATANSISGAAIDLPLSASEYFMEQYVEQMMFPLRKIL